MNPILTSRSRWLVRLDFFLVLLLTGIRRGQFFQLAASSQAAGCKIFMKSSNGWLQDVVQSGQGDSGLQLPPTPPRPALADALVWFRANGYVK
jgi:hypothetical protein